MIYHMVNKASDTAEIVIYGPIGVSWFDEGVTASQFQKDLKAIGNVKTIDLRINSEGGVITDARTMYNLLNEHPATLNVHVDGLAASAASFLAMAGDHIEIAEGGFIMIHNARSVAVGEADDFEQMATLLRSFTETIVDTYVSRTGNKASQVKEWMDAETWFDGKEAVAKGFADRYIPNKKAVACVGSSKYIESFKCFPRDLRPNRAKALDMMRAGKR